MKKFLDYGASIVAVLIIVAVWRFVLHYLFALAIFASFCLYLGVPHWIRKVGGKYGRWILDEPERA